MEVELDIRDGEVNQFLRVLVADQLPFATSWAVNLTALDFQGEQREHMGEIFTVRRKGFVNRSVKIRRQDFATKENPVATVRIETPGGGERNDILTKFETDRSKTPFSGGMLAIPTDNVPRTGAGIVRKRWRPRSLQEATESGVSSERGRTFRKGSAIYARTRDGGLKLLYVLRPSVPIEPNLNFVENAGRTVVAVWGRNFTYAFDRSIGLRRQRPSGIPGPASGQIFSTIRR